MLAPLVLVWKIWNNHFSETSSRNTAPGFHSSELSCSHPKAVARSTIFESDNLFSFGLKNYISLHSSITKNLFQDQICGAGGFTYHHQSLLSLEKEAIPNLGSLENYEQGFSYALHMGVFSLGSFQHPQADKVQQCKNWQEGNKYFAKLKGYYVHVTTEKKVLQLSPHQINTILHLFQLRRYIALGFCLLSLRIMISQIINVYLVSY